MTNVFDVAALQALLSSKALVFDALGLVAGALVAISGMPKVIQRVRDRRNGRNAFSQADLLRDSAQALGNLIWVIVGANIGLISVTLFCAIQATLMGLLVSLNLQARRTAPMRSNPWIEAHTPLRAPTGRGVWPELG